MDRAVSARKLTVDRAVSVASDLPLDDGLPGVRHVEIENEDISMSSKSMVMCALLFIQNNTRHINRPIVGTINTIDKVECCVDSARLSNWCTVLNVASRTSTRICNFETALCI